MTAVNKTPPAEPIANARVEMAALDRLTAKYEFALDLRALGPMPARLQPDTGAAPTRYFDELVAELEDYADAADARVRRLALSARASQSPDGPHMLAIAVAVAGFWLWCDSDTEDECNITSVAGSLGLTRKEMRWAVRYARLLARLLRRLDPAMFSAFLMALTTVVEILTTGVGGRVLYRTSGIELTDRAIYGLLWLPSN
jgi:hypothetical protein